MATTRKPLMAGNWKMNLNHLEAIALVQKLAFALNEDDFASVDVAVLPPFTDIRSVQTLVENGFKFCVRYVPLPDGVMPSGGTALSSAEAQTILDAGLALMVAQVGVVGSVTEALGTTNGQYAVSCCQSIGLPAGVNVWLDLEGVSGDVMGYANDWSAAVSKAGYVPGVYVGAPLSDGGEPITGDELFNWLNFSHYWRSPSVVPDAGRGYQMIQLWPSTSDLLGIGIDIDVTQVDRNGDVVQWLAPTTG